MVTMAPLGLLTSLFFLPLLSNASIDDIIPKNQAGMNVIDRCWRNNPNWAENRQSIAACCVGFAGKMKKNKGKNVTMYEVTDSSDDASTPRVGTLRYGATLIPGKVWITFREDMFIKLERPLYVSSYTAIDGRGANVHIAYGSGIVAEKVRNVIIHGLQFHHIQPTAGGHVVLPGGKITPMHKSDGDAIRLVSAFRVWVDHNTLYRGQDGLIDVTHESNRITISNNWFKDHNKVMLIGHEDHFLNDFLIRVTLVYNRFGPNCVQRMPRIRSGYVHTVNNLYDEWLHYAVGGSNNPTILSQANLYIAPNSRNKGIIWQQSGKHWHVKSVDDLLLNGAFFSKLPEDNTTPHYGPQQRFVVGRAENVRLLTKDAGALRCRRGGIC